MKIIHSIVIGVATKNCTVIGQLIGAIVMQCSTSCQYQAATETAAATAAAVVVAARYWRARTMYYDVTN